MSTPQAKRRRLNEAAKALHKPFKSPFRAPLKPGIGSDPPSSDPPELNTYESTQLQATPPLSKTSNEHMIAPAKQTAATPGPSKPRVSKSLPSRSSLSTPSRTVPKKGTTKPTLTREIMQLRNEMQILSQAHTLATSTKDDDLVVLIDKWRTVSRTVAEELFATTRDKVNRMGGVGAWKAREKEGKERQQQWDKEEREAEREKLEEARENGELGDEAYDKYAEMAEDNGGDEKEEETFKAADDDSFTMDMMLKTLNIDLQLIGYNKEAQRWEG
ncbi:hypothetical protein HBI24_042180 [Parastagonospora nodorum]|nr:hypothetical protein HBH51_071740 [Parastagonospora nodorum]KAH4208442.1 hypothetical protein HBI95_090680 [Parastagonospora nodorum]KAH5051261.1 hypothetical protein HBH96_175660 [Parastagonospora nodorum]KAH5070387.1 hypothetical protein HBH95_179050 [Parastagonospora nodorum]KAH5362680.1 hypothetical protein HBI33_190940 [Parastagonospora nodorum]